MVGAKPLLPYGIELSPPCAPLH
jgi:hypothetical protein